MASLIDAQSRARARLEMADDEPKTDIAVRRALRRLISSGAIKHPDTADPTPEEVDAWNLANSAADFLTAFYAKMNEAAPTDSRGSTDLALFKGALQELDAAPLAILSRIRRAGQGVVLLCDNSTSMLDVATTSRGPRMHTVRHRGVPEQRPMPRHAALCEALTPIRHLGRVIAFADDTRELGPYESMPEPGTLCGVATNVAKAIEHATLLYPARTILISDGAPNVDRTGAARWMRRDAGAAFDAAKKLPGILETVFVGDEKNLVAKAFMRDIATRCGGDYTDLSEGADQLAPLLRRKLLPA
jgi:hypothetical protein